MPEIQAALNQLAGTTGLDATAAANRLAGTTGLELVGALNRFAGTTGLELDGVVQYLFGSTQGYGYAVGATAQGLLGREGGVALLPVGQVICTMPGAYSFLGTKAGTHNAQGNDVLKAMPIFVSEPVTLDRIGCEVTAIGQAGSVIRLGIYAKHATSDWPDALVLDAGTVAADSTGVKEITISQALSPGQYWLAAAIQGAPTTQPTVRISDERVGVPFTNGATHVPWVALGLGQSGVSGALPNAISSIGYASTMTRVFVRVV